MKIVVRLFHHVSYFDLPRWHFLFCFLIVVCSACSSTIDKRGEELVKEVEARQGVISETDWKVYDERFDELQREFDEKSGSLPDAVRSAYQKQIGKYKMLRVMSGLDAFKMEMKDALDQVKGAMELVQDSLDERMGAVDPSIK